MTNAFISYLQESAWKSKLMTVFKSVMKKVAVLDQISTAGKITERIAGLSGTSVGSLVGVDSSPTPLESLYS
jgi:hypothetical protein